MSACLFNYLKKKKQEKKQQKKQGNACLKKTHEKLLNGVNGLICIFINIICISKQSDTVAKDNWNILVLAEENDNASA